MKNNRQRAIEYLATYGWAVLVVIIVGVVLWQMGIFEAGTDYEERCLKSCTDQNMTGSYNYRMCLCFDYDCMKKVIGDVENITACYIREF